MDTYYFTLHTNFTLIMYQNREECNQRGGTEDGTCASGFGVCCICKFSKLTAKLNQGPLITDGQNKSKWTGPFVGLSKTLK